jgi:hypothetical protein
MADDIEARVTRHCDGDLTFPIHWAVTSETSVVARPSDYRSALEAAGFEIRRERDRGAPLPARSSGKLRRAARAAARHLQARIS